MVREGVLYFASNNKHLNLLVIVQKYNPKTQFLGVDIYPFSFCFLYLSEDDDRNKNGPTTNGNGHVTSQDLTVPQAQNIPGMYKGHSKCSTFTLKYECH